MLNIIQDRDGYLVDGILFPVVSKGSSQWVQSPYTSYAIKNKKD